MKIWIHRYELKPREAKAKPRQGVLIKSEWTTGLVGYSDLHPWPEFGEAPLDEHIAALKNLVFTPLVEKSMEFNYQDYVFRSVKRNAFLGLILPRSHRLVFDLEAMDPARLHEWHIEGYTHIKVKMGRDLKAETEALVHLAYSTPLLCRVDFTGRISNSEFVAWWNSLDAAIKARIDFVEDPVDADALKLDGPWANDWKSQANAKIRIVKPARDSEEELSHYARVIFTHSLDHTFGQACAVWTAAKYYMRHPRRMEVCGLGATNFFEPDLFSRAWNCPGPRMKPTVGTGFGFDDLLTTLVWERLL